VIFSQKGTNTSVEISALFAWFGSFHVARTKNLFERVPFESLETFRTVVLTVLKELSENYFQ
jgi:hypothetical protein